MPTNQIIGNFIDAFARRDVQRNNLFRVTSLNTRVLTLDKDDLLYIRTGKIPARKNNTANMMYHGMRLPYNVSSIDYEGNEDWSFEFVFDARNQIRTKLEQASRLVFNDQTNTGNWQAPSLSDTMTCETLDINLNTVDKYTFYGVAFKGIDAVDFQQAEGDGSGVNIMAHVSYYYYKCKGSDTVFKGVDFTRSARS